MSKKDTSYADAMNEWAAKQSFLRNKRNRLLHPNPESGSLLRFLGYLFRLVVLLFLLWTLGAFLANRYYNGATFNKEIKAEVKDFLKADQFDALSFTWRGKQGACKKITATGSEAAPYRKFEANQIAYQVSLLKRIRKAWTIDELRIDQMSIGLKSGGKTKVVGPAGQDDIPVIAAGLLPTPDLDQLKINRLSCQSADISWGLSRATLGAIEGTNLELYSATENWQIDLTGGELRQNWLHSLMVKSLRVNREGNRLVLSRSAVGLGKSPKTGTLEGQVALGRLPEFDLKLSLPHAHSRDLMPTGPGIREMFYGELSLELAITGSINTIAGIEMSGTGRFTKATFNEVPAFEAVDKMLKIAELRLFTPDKGEFTFSTSEGKLKVSSFEFREENPGIVLRGEFTYTPGITSSQADASNPNGLGGPTLQSRKDEIVGKLRLGVRPELVGNNELAKKYFQETADGHLWMEIPLSGPLAQATTKLKAEILSAIRDD